MDILIFLLILAAVFGIGVWLGRRNPPGGAGTGPSGRDRGDGQPPREQF